MEAVVHRSARTRHDQHGMGGSVVNRQFQGGWEGGFARKDLLEIHTFEVNAEVSSFMFGATSTNPVLQESVLSFPTHLWPPFKTVISVAG